MHWLSLLGARQAAAAVRLVGQIHATTSRGLKRFGMVDLDAGSPATGGSSDLLSALAAADDARAACEITVAHLVATGYPMPSIYLYRGSRLRCYAVRGYWQVFDGMPAAAGVIGRCFRTGQPVELRRVHESVDYLAAIPGVRVEVCVPLRIGGHVVGALNVESLTDLPAGAVDHLAEIADLLGERLRALGGVPQESAYQRLAVHAQRFAAATGEPTLQQLVLSAARDLSGLDSAALAVQTDGELTVAAASGTLESALRQFDQHDLRLFHSWVTAGTSCYSVNDASGQAFEGHDQVRQAGAQTVVVVPLLASQEDLGLLVVADPAAVLPEPAMVELLEVLGALTATSLRTVRALELLRRQAARDPLTDLGHAGTFRSAMEDALRRDDATRAAVAVMDIDKFKAVNDAHGHQVGDELLQRLADGLTAALRDGEQLYRIGGDEFAAILVVADARDAESAAQRLLAAAREIESGSLSLGMAIAADGESSTALVRRADQALYRAKRAGRDTYRISTKAAGA